MRMLLTRVHLVICIAPETMGEQPKTFRNRHLDGDNGGKIFLPTAVTLSRAAEEKT